jgi:hypothetical protein
LGKCYNDSTTREERPPVKITIRQDAAERYVDKRKRLGITFSPKVEKRLEMNQGKTLTATEKRDMGCSSFLVDGEEIVFMEEDIETIEED